MAPQGERGFDILAACYKRYSEKTKLDESFPSSNETAVNCLLYEARNNLRTQHADEIRFKEKLHQINPAMPLAQIINPTNQESEKVATRFGKFPEDHMEAISYLLQNPIFKIFCDITLVPRIDSNEQRSICSDSPQFPVNDVDNIQYSNEVSDSEKRLL